MQLGIQIKTTIIIATNDKFLNSTMYLYRYQGVLHMYSYTSILQAVASLIKVEYIITS